MDKPNWPKVVEGLGMERRLKYGLKVLSEQGAVINPRTGKVHWPPKISSPFVQRNHLEKKESPTHDR